MDNEYITSIKNDIINFINQKIYHNMWAYEEMYGNSIEYQKIYQKRFEDLKKLKKVLEDLKMVNINCQDHESDIMSMKKNHTLIEEEWFEESELKNLPKYEKEMLKKLMRVFEEYENPTGNSYDNQVTAEIFTSNDRDYLFQGGAISDIYDTNFDDIYGILFEGRIIKTGTLDDILLNYAHLQSSYPQNKYIIVEVDITILKVLNNVEILKMRQQIDNQEYCI